MTPQSWVGRTIGYRYKLETLLGTGGMSAVYRAYDPNLRRAVAVKLIHPHLSDNPNFVNRFKEEAAAVASLRHPNIVQVHDFNNEGDTYYMVMEYLAGETLQAHLRRVNAAGRQLPLAEALRIGLQICDAAGYAHRHDLVHRDIKPANIMLDVYGQAILMDFGIVKIVGGQYHTATGATIGTATYMSPEQIRSERVDERSDIYSMGVMLFEMLSGRPPYEADSALTLMMMHLNDPVPAPSDLRPDVSPRLAAVVIKALAKDRDQRYQTAAEMASDLQKAGLAQDSITLDTSTIATAGITAPGVAPSAPEPAPTLPDDNLTQSAPEPISSPQPQTEPTPAILPTEADSSGVDTPPSELELPASSISATRSIRQLPRWLLPIFGLALFAVLAVAIIWFINQRRPPDLRLTPVERPNITINLESQARIVNLGQWQVDAYCEQLAFSPDLDRLASVCNREEVRFSPYRFYASLWQVNPGVLQVNLVDHTAWMKSLDFSPDGAMLATSSDDERIDLWQVRDGVLLRTIESDQGPIASLDFSPNGMVLAGAIWDGVGLWQVSNGNLLRIYSSNENSLRSVSFSPDGEYLAGGSEAGEVFLWRVDDGDLIRTLPGHTAQVNQVAFSPDGTQLASASDDKTLNLWMVQDGGLVARLIEHTEGVTGVAFSNDGSLLVSSSWDGTLRLWQASDGLALRAIQFEDSLIALAFSPDNVWLTAASSDGRFSFWGVSEAISLLPVSLGRRP